MAAKRAWAAMPFDERAAVFLRAADLLAGPWREKIAAATMLGQSKTAIQAEIDAACELDRLLALQRGVRARRSWPSSRSARRGAWNRSDYRPLEGFVYAITPFNFTAIAGNLPTAPALMGNTVVWKPSVTQTLSALPDHAAARGRGPAARRDQPADRRRPARCPTWSWPIRGLAGIHFTGSTATFQHLWRRSATTSTATTPTRGWSARPAARTSSSHTRRPTGCVEYRADSRRLRLPGPEVLGGIAGVHPAFGVAAAWATTSWRADVGTDLWRRHRLDATSAAR